MDYIEISSVPFEEPCVQVGSPDYSKWARIECNALINQLRRVHGSEPLGARLVVRSNPHDFGTYYEVACKYDDQNELAAEYAFACENGEGIATWDREAKEELQRQGYPLTSESYDPAEALGDAMADIEDLERNKEILDRYWPSESEIFRQAERIESTFKTSEEK